MNHTNQNTSIFTIIIVLVFIVLSQAGGAIAEEMPESEAKILTKGSRHTGTINSITPEQSMVIIDDRSFILDRVIRFNNASWSREQVFNRLEPGRRVEIEVGDVIDSSRGARRVVSLKVLNQ